MIRLADIIGKSKEDAIEAILNSDADTFRIAIEDNMEYILTQDHDSNRVNLSIENGIVSNANIG